MRKQFTCTAKITESATRWLNSLPINTFVDSLAEAKKTWKIRFVFTNIGPNSNVKEKWNPALPKIQSPSVGLSMCANTVANARYIPASITRSICSPTPLTTRKFLFLIMITEIIIVSNIPRLDEPANKVPYTFPHVKNIWGMAAHSICCSSAGHCFSGHSSHEVPLSTRTSLLRHAKHFQQQNLIPTTLKCAAGHGALHMCLGIDVFSW